MPRVRSAFATGAVLLALTGCTDLYVRPVLPGASPSDSSLFYALPATVIQVTPTYKLVSCTGVPVIDASYQTTIGYGGDPYAQYRISYEDHRTFLKDQNDLITRYPNGALKTFNSTRTDNTIAIAMAAIQAAASVAGDVLKAQYVQKYQGPPPLPPNPQCTPAAKLALSDLQKFENKNFKGGKLDDKGTYKQIDYEQYQKNVQFLSFTGDQQTYYPTVSNYKTPWSPLTYEMPNTAWVTDGSSLTPVTTLTINLASMDPDIMAVDPAASAPAAPAGSTGGASTAGTPAPVTGKDVKAKAGVKSKLKFADALNLPLSTTPVTLPEQEGMALREPIPGIIYIRTKHGSGPFDTETKTANFSQFGKIFHMRLFNGLAESDTLQVEMAEDGVITKMGFQTVSSLKNDLGGVSSAATSVQGLETDSATSATTRNKNEADCLSAVATIKAAGGKPVASCN